MSGAKSSLSSPQSALSSSTSRRDPTSSSSSFPPPSSSDDNNNNRSSKRARGGKGGVNVTRDAMREVLEAREAKDGRRALEVFDRLAAGTYAYTGSFSFPVVLWCMKNELLGKDSLSQKVPTLQRVALSNISVVKLLAHMVERKTCFSRQTERLACQFFSFQPASVAPTHNDNADFNLVFEGFDVDCLRIEI